MKIVNFGCGSSASSACINIDGSPTVILARLPVPAKLFGSRMHFVKAVRDYKIRFCTARRLRFADSSLDAFYASHILEHISRLDCENLLTRVRNWLKPGGVLRVVLPDLKQLAADYLSGKIDADTYVLNTALTRPRPRRFRTDGYSQHLWMYDSDSFIKLLRSLDYREIRTSGFGSSRMPELASLDVAAREHESFYVEALK